MFKGIIEYIQDKDIFCKINNGEQLTFTKATDFLYVDDIYFLNNFLTENINDSNFHNLVHNLQYRRHFVRSAIISYDTVGTNKEKTEEEKNNWFEFLNAREEESIYNRLSEDNLRKIAGEIYEEVKKTHPNCLKQEIWLDVPHIPKFSEAEKTYVAPSKTGESPIKFSNFFPSEQWAKQYVVHKYRAHIFCPQEYVDATAKAGKQILKDKFGLDLNNLAFELCKVTPPA